MFSTESWPRPVARAWTLGQRFQKFLVVGTVGIVVSQAFLFLLHGVMGIDLALAGPVAIGVSMVATFILNEMWTWHDRGTGRIVHRMLPYAVINTVGLIINSQVLVYLVEEQGVHFLVANLIGAGIAAVWNFLLNNAVTWRA